MQFAAQAVAWQEKLVEISEENLKGAQAWVRDMKVRWRLGCARRPDLSTCWVLLERNPPGKCFELQGWQWLRIDAHLVYKGCVNPAIFNSAPQGF